MRNRPATIATRPITDPTERSMPPVMMTTVIPIAMIPIGAKLRVTLAAFSVVPKVGSLMAMTTTSTISAIVTQNGWLAKTRAARLCSLCPTTSAMAGMTGFGRLDEIMLHGSLP